MSPRSDHGVPQVLPQQQKPRKDPDADREVFRSPGSIVLSWAWLIVAVITLADLAIQGRDRAAAITALLIIAISSVVYGCAWRPRIIADSAGVTLANPLRDYRVPWGAVTNVDVVNSVRVHCPPAPGASTGKVIYSWAVQSSPSSARRAARRAGVTGQRPRLTRPARGLRNTPPPGASPGYGQIPESARDALDRTSAEFTAARLAERAQHARQAAIVQANLAEPDNGQQPGTGQQRATDRPGTDGQTVAAAAGDAVAERPVAMWAWGPIAAMLISTVALLIVWLA